ncbi:hypothetical protein H5410_051380 [Solanum commersonii]|uniref:Uncharacterized protein n=1 Tax=Solanum commersonii TaxID=4109 RepID=A0A9J5WY07_SOLCO|nr:hypothetical protein H5410_051380 [Solanum commersonii]
MIFLLENSDIQRREEPWKIFQRYLVNGLYFPSESYKTRKYYETLLISTGVEFQHFSGYNTSENVYNFSKMIIKHIIHIEDWGISSMTERQFSLNKVMVSFTYWDYIQAFNKVLCYNNERHKHTWFIKLYKEWVKVSPDLNKLYHQEHICYFQQIEQIYFFIEFSVPWIHKWVPEVDFTEEQIPFDEKRSSNKVHIWTRTAGSNYLKPHTDYKTIPNKGIMTDDSTSVKHMARKISNHDEGEQNEMIMRYLEEVKKKILLNISHYAKNRFFNA